MQTTSSLYKQIVAGNHYFENKVSIDGHDISQGDIISLRIIRSGMSESKPTVGGALSATLDLTILEPSFDVPKMATVIPYFRAKNETRTSEWLPMGRFFIDTRSRNEKARQRQTLTISAFDAMMKFEQDYPSTSHSWPYKDTSVIAEMASAAGISVDARTNQLLTAGYMIDLPLGYNMRETLQNIAASYGGNFVISNEGKLLYAPLFGFDPDVSGNYLADESGNALVFGNEGWWILV